MGSMTVSLKEVKARPAEIMEAKMLNQLEKYKYKCKVIVSFTLPDISVVFTTINHFWTWSSLFPGDHQPLTI